MKLEAENSFAGFLGVHIERNELDVPSSLLKKVLPS